MQRTHRQGFTLIELLVVIAIIALLIGILLPSLGAARSTSHRLVCATAQRGIALASTLYADQHPKEVFLPTGGGGSDNLAYLDGFLEQPEAAICPATNNEVDGQLRWLEDGTVVGGPIESPLFFRENPHGRDVAFDLSTNATEAAFNGVNGAFTNAGYDSLNNRGHSFEFWGWFSYSTSFGLTKWPDGSYRQRFTSAPTAEQVADFRNRQRGLRPNDPAAIDANDLVGEDDGFDTTAGAEESYIKSHRSIKFPSWTLLTLDGDEDHIRDIWEPLGRDSSTGRRSVIGNWPDKETNNHGELGVNISFADGHVDFKRKGSELLATYVRSRHVGVSGAEGLSAEIYDDYDDAIIREPTMLGRNRGIRFIIRGE